MSLLLLSATSSSAQGVSLYQFVPDSEIKSEKAIEYLRKFRRDKRISDVYPIKIDFLAFQSDWISMQLPDGEVIQINRRYDVPESSQKRGEWIGEIRKGGNQDELFITTIGSISGTLRYRNKIYPIRALGNGNHAIMQSLPVDLPIPDNGAVTLPNNSDNASEKLPSPASSTKPIIRVLIGYTEAAAKFFGEDAPESDWRHKNRA